MRIREFALVLLVLAAACGKTHKAGTTPEATVKSLEGALRDLELGQCYDLLSKRSQREMDQGMQALKSLAAVIPDDKLAEIGMKGLKDMSTRQILDASVKYAKKEQPTAVKRLAKIQYVVLDVKEYGADRARVKISRIVDGRAREQSLPMVREGGLWKFDVGQSDLELPVRLGPDVQAAAADCFT